VVQATARLHFRSKSDVPGAPCLTTNVDIAISMHKPMLKRMHEKFRIWPFCAWRSSRVQDVIVPCAQVALFDVVLHLFGLVWWASFVFAFGGTFLVMNSVAVVDYLFLRLRNKR
jgi:hypothetical protein